MHVLFEDDFSGLLSISKTGAGTRYASLKPDWPNGSEFGEAIFADPTDAVNPFSILGDDHLRIRVSKAPDGYADPQGWNRKHIGGLLSSVRLDGTGIAATNGYFEARIQMPAGKGAWPAFWLMSQNSAGPGHLPSTAEIDTVEAYSHDPSGACQAKHWWSGNPESHETNCSSTNFAYGDNASTWHTYGTKITPEEIIYYIDNVEVWRHVSFEQANTPMYFMLNLALGGGWPIDLAKYGDQIDMYVDYVRVFEPDAITNPNPATQPSSQPEPKVQGDAVIAPVDLSIASSTGAATLSLNADTWKQAQELARKQDVHKIVLEAPPIAKDAKSFELKLPASALDGSSGLSVEVRTAQASLVLPEDMLEGQSLSSDIVSIHINNRDSGSLGDDVKKQVGLHPVIDLTAAVDGQIVAWNNPQAPVTVRIPYVPTAEELLHPEHIVVWYIDGAGNITAVPNGHYDPATQSVVFKVTHFSTYAVSYAYKSFEDISLLKPASKKAIEVLASRGIIKGTSEKRFSPGKAISRADFILLLSRVLEWQGQAGSPFSDLPAQAYYSEAVHRARALGVIKGSGNNQFRPGDPISREEMIVVMQRAIAAANIPATSALDAKLIEQLSLSSLPTRAETAEVLYQLYSLVQKVEFGRSDVNNGR
ncbi:S-layer homology domain-containing protein [Paenibacillus glycanilyticus]|uniref:S-layer homology domain-containing protein n=1 Tax=Paenibacillus glycanilyticus TaxID=126569 RepID=UPI0020410C0B|nr:S-layer homology domain-containing protein [Paenibacillus glycanilyticus]MCM3626119.1 S-layer homology domain-containing protein [Paenibacillus glycanilyticus]